jgi:hypothetical protein
MVPPSCGPNLAYVTFTTFHGPHLSIAISLTSLQTGSFKSLASFSETRKLLWKAETKLDTKNLEYLKKLAEEEKKVKVN